MERIRIKMNRILKKTMLMALAVFMVLGTTGLALAYSTAGQYEVVFWWDTDGDLLTTETDVTLAPGDTLNASLYVSGIDSGYGWSSFTAEIGWDDTLFNNPAITVDDTTWGGPEGPGNESVGPPFYANQGAAPGVFNSGDDIKLLDITLENFGGVPTVLVTDGDGLTSMGMDWSTHVAANWPAGASFEAQDLNINAVPVPAAVWLLGSGLLGLVGIRRRN
jgi:hypothetical protein